MKLRQWKLLSGVALLVIGFLWGASAPAEATTGGCTGDIVIALDFRVIDRDGSRAFEVSLPDAVPPGIWAINTVSSDAYDDRVGITQPHEQWVVDLGALGVFGPTTDLDDAVASARVHDQLGSVVAPEGIDRLTVRHAFPGDSSNSANAECIGFTLVEAPGDGLEATADVDCAAGEVVVTVRNPGSLSASYRALSNHWRSIP